MIGFSAARPRSIAASEAFAAEASLRCATDARGLRIREARER